MKRTYINIVEPIHEVGESTRRLFDERVTILIHAKQNVCQGVTTIQIDVVTLSLPKHTTPRITE